MLRLLTHQAAASQDPYASYDVNGNDYDPSPRYDASNENKYVPRTPPCCRPTDGHDEAPLRPPGPRVGLSRAPAAGPGLEAMSPLRPAWPGGSSGRAPAASLIGCFKGVTVKPTVARPNRVEPAVRPVCAHGS